MNALNTLITKIILGTAEYLDFYAVEKKYSNLKSIFDNSKEVQKVITDFNIYFDTDADAIIFYKETTSTKSMYHIYRKNNGEYDFHTFLNNQNT